MPDTQAVAAPAVGSKGKIRAVFFLSLFLTSGAVFYTYLRVPGLKLMVGIVPAALLFAIKYAASADDDGKSIKVVIGRIVSVAARSVRFERIAMILMTAIVVSSLVLGPGSVHRIEETGRAKALYSSVVGFEIASEVESGGGTWVWFPGTLKHARVECAVDEERAPMKWLGTTPFCEDVVAVEWGPWCDTYAPNRPALASYVPQVRQFKNGTCDETVVYSREELLEALRRTGTLTTPTLIPPLDLVPEDRPDPKHPDGPALRNWKLFLKDSANPRHSSEVHISYAPSSGGRDHQIHLAGQTFHVRRPLKSEGKQFVLTSL